MADLVWWSALSAVSILMAWASIRGIESGIRGSELADPATYLEVIFLISLFIVIGGLAI